MRIRSHLLLTASLLFILFGTRPVLAHCDTVNGPVVTAARTALTSGDIVPLLRWVSAGDEAELRAAYAETMAVRQLNARSRALADRYFFETTVRLHRKAEGEPFTGIHPAEEAEPIIVSADAALAKGSSRDLESNVVDPLLHEMRARFDAVMETKKHADESVAAGREYVAAYVSFIHYVESIHTAVVAEHDSERSHQ
jgi:hypothetical protein